MRIAIATGLVVVGDLIGEGAAQEQAARPIAAPICAISLTGAKRSSRAISESRKVGGIASVLFCPAYSQ